MLEHEREEGCGGGDCGEVEHLMVAKDTRPWVRLVEGVRDGAEGLEHATQSHEKE